MNYESNRSPRRARTVSGILLCLLISLLNWRAAAQTVVSWVGDSGDWSDPANWSTGVLPGPDDDVTIDRPGAVTVTHASGTSTIKSLRCHDALTLSGGSLTVSNTVQVDNGFVLAGGALATGTVLRGTNGQPVVVTSGRLDGVALASDVAIGNGAALTIENGLTLVGGATVSLNSAEARTFLYMAPGMQTISGQGQIVLGGASAMNNYFRLGNPTETILTLGPGVTVRGAGNIDQFDNSALINQGTIHADVPGQPLSIGLHQFSNEGALRISGAALLNLGLDWNNRGTIQVDNATLNLGGSFTGRDATAGFSRNRGVVNVSGTLKDGVALDATTGSWNLNGGTLRGGTYSASGGAQFTVRYGTLDGLILASDISIGNGAYLSVEHGLTLMSGATIFLNAAEASTTLYLAPGSQTIGGNGQIVLGGSSPMNNSFRLGNPTGTTLTLEPGVTLRGSGNINQFADSTLVNQGTIHADVPGQSLSIGLNYFSNEGALHVSDGATLNLSRDWSNSGTFQVDDATLNLGGSFSGPEAVNGFSRNGGTVNLTGTVNDGLALDSTTGSWNLSDGTISGGTLSASDGVRLTVSSGTFDGVRLASDVSISDGAYLVIDRGLTFVGGAAISLNAADSSTFLYAAPGTQILGGNGQIVLAGTSPLNNYFRLGHPAATTLTLGPSVTVRGAGHIDQSNTSTLRNRGTIHADVPGQTISINVGQLSNTGALRASGGGALNLRGNWSNSGTLEVSSGGTATISGDYELDDGTLNVGLNSYTDIGRINFSGPLVAAGEFTVSLLGGFRPNPGDAFPVLSYASATNEFACHSGLDLGEGVMLVPHFGQTLMTLMATSYPAPNDLPSLFIGPSPTGVRLFWSEGFPNWSLESTTNLLAPNWLVVPSPTECADQVVLPRIELEQYFRFKRFE